MPDTTNVVRAIVTTIALEQPLRSDDVGREHFAWPQYRTGRLRTSKPLVAAGKVGLTTGITAGSKLASPIVPEWPSPGIRGRKVANRRGQ